MSENVPNLGPMKIQIRKGLGITHALKELVEKQKMELSDGKITAKEWNSVLDKLIEIQQNRQASGKSSIFGGGTDKTRAGWHNSFVVHPNQEIEFTAEEAAELYEAIGAKFTKSSTPVTTEPLVPAPTAPVDSTGTTSPVAPAPTAPVDSTETTPPAAPAPTAPKTELPEGVTEEARINEVGGEYTAQIKDGKDIKHQYEDFDVTFEYDANGNKTKSTITRGDGTIENIEEYQKGNLVKDTYYNSDGKKANFAYAYEYDADGNKTKSARTRGDGTIENIEEYQNGNIVKETYYKEDGKTVDHANAYEYDGDGNETKSTKIRGDGTISNIEEYEKGNLVKDIYYAADGKTVMQMVTDGKLEYQCITAPNKNTYKYHYNEDEICVSSGLADALKDQISGPSLNSNTISLLKQITPENVIKVLTSYNAGAKESLEDAIKAEWGMGQEEIDEYINKALAERKKTLKIKDDQNLTLEELAKLDSEYTRNRNE